MSPPSATGTAIQSIGDLTLRTEAPTEPVISETKAAKQMSKFPGPPKFEDKYEEREYLKGRLAAAFRIFGKYGFDEGVAGHITVRDPVDPSTFWVNPFGVAFSMIKKSDLIQVDDHGNILGGGPYRMLNKAAFVIHGAVHQARPDVTCAAHSHSIYGRSFCTLGRKIDMITQDSCSFHNDLALYSSFNGIVLADKEGKEIAHALGNRKAALLQNHGLLTVADTIEAAVFWFVSLEKCCHAQLMADAAAGGRGHETVKIKDDDAEFTYKTIGTPMAGWFKVPKGKWGIDGEDITLLKSADTLQSGRGGGGMHGDRQRAPRADTRGDEVSKTNTLYEKYYNRLAIVQDSERDELWTSLRRELPNSFRFTGSKSQALPVQQLLKDHYIPEITSIEHNGEFVAPPTPIPWFPDQLAWQMTTPKNIVRRFPPFASFQKFLVSETCVGNISRQEVVSMIPPLLMDMRPGMTVLDLCAAPGSKAAQLLEMVHGGEEARMRSIARHHKLKEGGEASPEGCMLQEEMKEEEEGGDWSDDGRATGLLIANDADYKRAHMLTHQMKRLNSPNLIVTNHDATMYPSIKLPSDPGVHNQYLKFDRILADVPCSGDGTCRKNVNVWKDWIPGNALGLFSTQLRILVRALQMLKVGGRVVYSTCSMNPVENEAVVAAAIERCGGLSKVDVIDCGNALRELKRKPGLNNWQVMDKYGKIWQTWQEVEKERADHGEERLGRLAEGMFPHSADIPLDRCMRIYPHLQDTGGFFIAVLEKRTEIKARPENESRKVHLQSTSIVSAVNEIEAQPTSNGSDPTQRIEALDSIIAPGIVQYTEESSAAARQNKEVAPSNGIHPTKRRHDAEADAEMSTKRPKIREEVDDPAPEGAEDRQVHWPPPPGAVLDASRPETTTSLPKSPALFDGNNHTVSAKKKSRNQPYEEPFKYLSPETPELEFIYTFYALSPSFPRDRFMVRNATGTPAKTIYYSSSLAKAILSTNASSGIKFIHCGVRMFVKQDVQGEGVCRWRIQSEGLPLLEQWVGDDRCVRLYKKSTLRGLLVEMFPKVESGGWRTLGEIGERVRDMGMGCCVLRVEKSDAEDGFQERMTLPLWRSLHSLNLMLPKADRKAMLLRLFNEDTPLQDHSKDRFDRKPDAVKTAARDDYDDDDGGLIAAKAETRNEPFLKADGDEDDVAPAGLDEEDEDECGGVPLKEDYVIS
ncbi:MAG: hypothetical protein Q9217_003989 [Psora testacea]